MITLVNGYFRKRSSNASIIRISILTNFLMCVSTLILVAAAVKPAVAALEGKCVCGSTPAEIEWEYKNGNWEYGIADLKLKFKSQLALAKTYVESYTGKSEYAPMVAKEQIIAPLVATIRKINENLRCCNEAKDSSGRGKDFITLPQDTVDLRYIKALCESWLNRIEKQADFAFNTVTITYMRVLYQSKYNEALRYARLSTLKEIIPGMPTGYYTKESADEKVRIPFILTLKEINDTFRSYNNDRDFITIPEDTIFLNSEVLNKIEKQVIFMFNKVKLFSLHELYKAMHSVALIYAKLISVSLPTGYTTEESADKEVREPFISTLKEINNVFKNYNNNKDVITIPVDDVFLSEDVLKGIEKQVTLVFNDSSLTPPEKTTSTEATTTPQDSQITMASGTPLPKKETKNISSSREGNKTKRYWYLLIPVIGNVVHTNYIMTNDDEDLHGLVYCFIMWPAEIVSYGYTGWAVWNSLTYKSRFEKQENIYEAAISKYQNATSIEEINLSKEEIDDAFRRMKIIKNEVKNSNIILSIVPPTFVVLKCLQLMWHNKHKTPKNSSDVKTSMLSKFDCDIVPQIDGVTLNLGFRF